MVARSNRRQEVGSGESAHHGESRRCLYKALPGEKIRELCRIARVFLCHDEDVMGADPELATG